VPPDDLDASPSGKKTSWQQKTVQEIQSDSRKSQLRETAAVRRKVAVIKKKTDEHYKRRKLQARLAGSHDLRTNG